jgi:peptide chain release factor subunit 1
MVQLEKMDESFAQYKLKKQIDYLRNKRSEDGSTCMVSLYIPEGRQISDFMSQLTDELGTAANIKSKTTKKNVQTALNVTMGKLKLLGHKAPTNGLALFTGVTVGGRLESFVINPSHPITIKQYICDAFFHIDHLEEHLIDKKRYGLITLDAGYATIAILQGNAVKILKSTQSNVPKKHKAGGQSAPRFQRIRIMETKQHLDHVAEYAKNYFIEDGRYDVAGLIIGGPGILKNKLVEDGHFDNRLQAKVMRVVDIGMVSDKEGMAELIEKSKEILEGTRFLEEKQLVQKWLDMVYRDDDKATYGEAEIRKALELSAVDKLLASEDLEFWRVELVCQNSGESKFLTIPKGDLEKVEANPSSYFPECTSPVQVKDFIDLVEEIGELALNQGAHVEIISSATEEGQQLIHFGGLAGILRYSLNF